MSPNHITQYYKITAFAALLFLVACSTKDPNKEVEEMKKKIAATQLQLEKDADGTYHFMKAGGQPGKITILGSLIEDDASSPRFGQLDPRIRVIAKGGVGHLGQEISVSKNYQPSFGPPEVANVEREDFDQTLVSIGCANEVAADYASLTNLTLKPLPAPLTEDVLNINAHTILLCGKIPLFKENYVSFYTQELILVDAELTSTRAFGAFTIDTLRLNLIGKNKIQTEGPSGPITLSLTTSIYLKVLQAMSKQVTGTLDVISRGSSYQAK